MAQPPIRTHWTTPKETVKMVKLKKIMANKTQDYFNEAYRRNITPWAQADVGVLGYKFIQLCQTEKPKGKILDLGCGDGKFAMLFAKKGFDSYGIDFASEAIKQAKKKAKKLGILKQTHFQVGNVVKLPYRANFFDAAVDFGCLHHVKKCDWKKYLDNLAKVLKKDGLFFLTVFSKNTPSHYNFSPYYAKRSWNIHKEPIGIEHYDYFFSKRGIEDFFRDRFKILKITEAISGPQKQKVFQVMMKKL